MRLLAMGGKLIRLCRLQRRAEEALSRCGDDLMELREEFRDVTAGVAPWLAAGGMPVVALTDSGLETPSDSTLKGLAERGAVDVSISWDDEDKPTVVIDDYPPMYDLAPQEARLLQLLQEDSGEVTDEKVGWKLPKDLSEGMEKFTGRPLKHHSLTTAMSRLRNSMERQQNNRYFIQTHRDKGYRFARRVQK